MNTIASGNNALKGTVKAAKRHPKVSEKKRQKKGSQEVQAGGGSGGGSGFSEHAVLVGAC
ncbi:MAG: hypothetical protein EBT45_09030 [Alphaproteobacteria bacterium]|nr:hypothetical protein [Alphaproteobacteria bacterium]